MQPHDVQTIAPWWKNGVVWLLMAGPILVVLASLVSFYLAARNQDPVLSEDYYQKGIEINKTLRAQAVAAPEMAPAVMARNHAATGVAPVLTKEK